MKLHQFEDVTVAQNSAMIKVQRETTSTQQNAPDGGINSATKCLAETLDLL